MVMNALTNLDDLPSPAFGEPSPSPAASRPENLLSPRLPSRFQEHSDRIIAMIRKYPESGLILFKGADSLDDVQP